MLGASRSWGQGGPLPISISEVDALMRLKGVGDVEEREKYLKIVKQLDRIELNYLREKAKSK